MTKRFGVIEGDTLDADWERWADGRVWRLKRRRHFRDVDPGYARTAAEQAAEQMGKVVRSLRDRYFPKKYLWVQFADAEVKSGEPCPCGGRTLLRLHQNFLRCATCGAQLMVSESEEIEGASAHELLLRSLQDVHLTRVDRIREREIYRGYGEQDETPVFILAEFRGNPEEDLSSTPELAYERIEKVRVVPFNLLSDVFDVSSLWNRPESDWDLVL